MNEKLEHSIRRSMLFASVWLGPSDNWSRGEILTLWKISLPAKVFIEKETREFEYFKPKDIPWKEATKPLCRPSCPSSFGLAKLPAQEILKLKGDPKGKNRWASIIVIKLDHGVEFGPSLALGSGQNGKLSDGHPTSIYDLAHGWKDRTFSWDKRVQGFVRQRWSIGDRVFGGEDMVIANRYQIPQKNEFLLVTTSLSLDSMPKRFVTLLNISSKLITNVYAH